ncbi:MAG: hypothetical protein QGG39_18265, partial [Candidatus Poribacteria bacterium]|nr:hypothetical protein [Candidatus Poribacteria bacterium]
RRRARTTTGTSTDDHRDEHRDKHGSSVGVSDAGACVLRACWLFQSVRTCGWLSVRFPCLFLAYTTGASTDDHRETTTEALLMSLGWLVGWFRTRLVGFESGWLVSNPVGWSVSNPRLGWSLTQGLNFWLRFLFVLLKARQLSGESVNEG